MLNKELARRFLAGHKKANRVVHAEKAERLKTLSRRESRREYDQLCELWYGRPRDVPPVDESHLKALLRVRKVLALLRERNDQRPT